MRGAAKPGLPHPGRTRVSLGAPRPDTQRSAPRARHLSPAGSHPEADCRSRSGHPLPGQSRVRDPPPGVHPPPRPPFLQVPERPTGRVRAWGRGEGGAGAGAGPGGVAGVGGGAGPETRAAAAPPGGPGAPSHRVELGSSLGSWRARRKAGLSGAGAGGAEAGGGFSPHHTQRVSPALL